jgi:hypothetical protein
MEQEDREVIMHISETLDTVLAFLLKPKNRFIRIIDMVATGIGILGIISAIDIIKGWIGG